MASSRKSLNAIRDKAEKQCTLFGDRERAKQAWLRIFNDHKDHPEIFDARVAMLSSLADGDTIEAAENAARKVLAA